MNAPLPEGPATAPPDLDSPLHVLPVGERLGVWRIVEDIQVCASGHWYRGEHSMAPEQQVAVLVYEQAADAALVLLRFAEEQPGLQSLRHLDISLPQDSGLTADGLPYVVLRWMDGQPLLPAASELPLRKRLELICDLCDLLDVLHEHGQVLRELDPGTLWLSPQQRLRLMGQGLAPMLATEGLGDFGYSSAAIPLLAPEQLDGQPAHLASEAYAVGMLMCLLVNGRLPGSDSLVVGHLGAPVHSLAAWVSLSLGERQALDAMLSKSTAASMMERYTTARALADDIRAWLAGEVPSPLPPTPTLSMPRIKPSRKAAPPPRPAWRQWLLPGIVVGVVGVLGLALWAFSQMHR